MNIIIVFFFGILGGVSRYEIGQYLPSIWHFPLATLIINLTGCYMFTFLVKNYLRVRNVHEKIILAIGTGYIGAFTTFSSFIMDCEHLLLVRDYPIFILYTLLSMGGGLTMSILGMKHGRKIKDV